MLEPESGSAHPKGTVLPVLMVCGDMYWWVNRYRVL